MPSIDRKQIIESLLHNLHAMRHKFMAGYAAKDGEVITPSQGFVLHLVAKNSPANVKTIAKELNITSSAATQLIDGLVEKGYLVRKNDPKDRRLSFLLLPEKAKKLFEEFKENRAQKMIAVFNALTDEELLQYAALNQKITDHIINKKD